MLEEMARRAYDDNGRVTYAATESVRVRNGIVVWRVSGTHAKNGQVKSSSDKSWSEDLSLVLSSLLLIDPEVLCATRLGA